MESRRNGPQLSMRHDDDDEYFHTLDMTPIVKTEETNYWYLVYSFYNNIKCPDVPLQRLSHAMAH